MLSYLNFNNPLVKWRCLLFLGSLRNEIAALSATFQTRTSSMEPLKKLRASAAAIRKEFAVAGIPAHFDLYNFAVCTIA
jgi:hypothetical protein